MLVIFIVLCLVTFATLSLASAKNDHDYSQRIADRRTAYYNACNTAETMLDTIDAELDDIYTNRHDDDDYFTSVKYALPALEMDNVTVSMNFTLEEPVVNLRIPVDDTQELDVTLTLSSPEATGDGYYRITQWQTVNTAEWSGDNSLHLIDINGTDSK